MLTDPKTYVESMKSTEIKALIRERRKLSKFIEQYNERRIDAYRSGKGETFSPSEDEKSAEEQQNASQNRKNTQASFRHQRPYQNRYARN